MESDTAGTFDYDPIAGSFEPHRGVGVRSISRRPLPRRSLTPMGAPGRDRLRPSASPYWHRTWAAALRQRAQWQA